MKNLLRSLLCCVLLVAPMSVYSQPFDGELARLAERHNTPDSLIKYLANAMGRYSLDGQLADSSIDLNSQAERSRFMARKLADWAQFDLNFDGSITAEEIQTFARFSVRSNHLDALFFLHQNDVDQDSALSVAELYDAIRTAHGKLVDKGQSRTARALLAEDTDGDGVITVSEMVKIVRDAYEACNC